MEKPGREPVTVAVLAVIPKARDLETHVRVITLEGDLGVEFRDYCPSNGKYGKGYWMPADPETMQAVGNAITQVGLYLTPRERA